MGNLAASGGFYVAMGCDQHRRRARHAHRLHRRHQPSSPTCSGLPQRFDVRDGDACTAGKLKDAGNPFRDMTPRATGPTGRRSSTASTRQFLQAVAEGRGPPRWSRSRRSPTAGCSPASRRRSSGSSTSSANFYDAVDLAKELAETHRASRGSSTRPTSGPRFLEDLLGGVAQKVAAVGGRDHARRDAAPPRRKARASTSWRARRRDPWRSRSGRPWRMEFIRPEKPTGCIFCTLSRRGGGGGRPAQPDRPPSAPLLHHPEPLPLQLRPRDGRAAGARLAARGPRARGLRRPPGGAARARWGWCAPPTGRRG